MGDYSEDYLLNKRVKIFQPNDGYRASIDAVMLAAAVGSVKKGDAILDVGSGTGAVSLCLAERFKTSGITIRGAEIQKKLASLAEMSAAANGFDFVHFENLDIFENPPPFNSFDRVVTNPPYSEADMPSPNDSKATAHNFKNAGLEKWISFCLKLTKPQGYFYIINRAEALEKIIAALYGKTGALKIIPIYSKEGQNAKRVIVCARKGSKAPLILTPGITMHGSDGAYSSQAERILRGGGAIGY